MCIKYNLSLIIFSRIFSSSIEQLSSCAVMPTATTIVYMPHKTYPQN